MEIRLANYVDPENPTHDIASDMANCTCLPVTYFGFQGKNGQESNSFNNKPND